MMKHCYLVTLAVLAFLASAPQLHAQFERHEWIEYVPFPDMVDVIAGANVSFDWSENTYYDVEITAILYEAFTGPQLDVDWSYGYSGETTSVSVSAEGEYGKDYMVVSGLTVYPYYLDEETMSFYDHGDVECFEVGPCVSIDTASEDTTRQDVWNDCEGGRYPQWVSKDGMSLENKEAWLEVFKIVISGPSESEPGADLTPPSVTITVDMGNDPFDSVNIILKTSVLAGSGGHTHEGSARSPAKLNKNGQWAQQHTFSTGSRTFTFQFKPSMGSGDTERGIAGLYAVNADFKNLVNVASHEVAVKYNLSQLEDSWFYYKKRLDPNHGGGDYHYGTASLISAIQYAAADFYVLHGMNQNPIQYMVVNDMSLAWGGLFDINGNWQPPHELHRTGQNVDVPWWVQTSSGPLSAPKNSLAWLKLKQNLELDLTTVAEHNNNHFHCYQQ